MDDVIAANDAYEDDAEFHFSKKQTPGCTDPTATNYDATATVDDGSCVFPVSGCTDPTATNYDPTATVDDGSCVFPIPGCTDPTATNYDATATEDDGSCTYPPPVSGCTDPTATNYNATATVDDGSCVFPVPGCMDPTATNYDPTATVDDGSCVFPVSGCTDPTATNYDPTATVDDGSCVFPIPGCTDPTATNYDATATVDDGSCTYPPPVSGCMDPTATNYDPTATVDDGSCVFPVSGCMDPTATNYDATATVDDGSCAYPCIPHEDEILYQPAQDEIPYEPASYAWDTRVAPMSKIQHDYLWCIEVDFKFNSFFGLNFSAVWVGAVKANSSPVNVIFWAYKLGSPWHQRWLDIVVADPLAANPPNPEPTFYTDRHWNHLFGSKKQSIIHAAAGTLNYDITRHESEPYVDSALYTGIIEKPPITGFKLNGVHSISGLTTEYNKTIQYKAQFTLDETKENTYMWYFRAFRYLPLSIQNTTTGIDLSAIGNSYADNAPPPFDTWSTTDVDSFKTWALTMTSVPNKYFIGPEILFVAAKPEIPYSPAVIGTCPIPDPIPGCTNPTATNYDPTATVDDGSCIPPVTPKQFTTSFTTTTEPSAAAMLDIATSLSQASVRVFSQDPDGIGFIPPIQWAEAAWDGIPLSDPASRTPEELCAWIKPTESGYVIRGLREKFYEVNPFKDNTAPTAAELDNWHLEVVRHFRAILANPNTALPNDRPIEFDARLFIEARWASERKHTTSWDTAYPGAQADPLNPDTSGPCWVGGVAVGDGHCGASFWPNTGTDKATAIAAEPYVNDYVTYPELENYLTQTNRQGNSEGVSGISADTPWSLKFAIVIANFLCTEGTSGHASPFISSRATMGLDWWFIDPNTLSFRGKYH